MLDFGFLMFDEVADVGMWECGKVRMCEGGGGSVAKCTTR